MNANILLQIDTVLGDTTEQTQAILKDIDPIFVFVGGLFLLLAFFLLFIAAMKLFAIIDRKKNINRSMQEDENEDIT